MGCLELLDSLHRNLRLGNEEEGAKVLTSSTRRRTLLRRVGTDRRLQSKELSRCVELFKI